MDLATLDELIPALAQAAGNAGVAIELRKDHADGFGLANTAVCDVSSPGSRVRVWEEGRGDYRFELEDAEIVPVWWGKRRKKQADLPEVVISLVLGKFEVRNGLVTVRLDETRSVTLGDRL